MTGFQRCCVATGRILLSLIFIMSGAQKLMKWQETQAQMQNENMEMEYVEILLIGAVIFELGGGLALLLGWRARLAAAVLLIFLIPVTLIFHDFWQKQGAEQFEQMIQFTKNITIMGGLLVAMGAGAGCCSLDARRERRRIAR